MKQGWISIVCAQTDQNNADQIADHRDQIHVSGCRRQIFSRRLGFARRGNHHLPPHKLKHGQRQTRPAATTYEHTCVLWIWIQDTHQIARN